MKSRLAAHAGTINIVLLILVLFLMTAVSILIISSINRDNAQSLVRVYSMEAADKFYSYLSQELTLVQKAAKSRAITAWFTDEENETKKKLAFDEMSDYIEILDTVHLYFGIQKSGNEFIVTSKEDFASPVSYDKLDRSNAWDKWYFECIESNNDYSLKIDRDKFSDIWRLWINHKVTDGGEIAGVFSLGLKVPDVFYDIFNEYDVKKVRGYIIDGRGVIQSDSTHFSIYGDSGETHIREESIDPAFATALANYEKRIDGFFGFHALPEVINLTKGSYECAAIEPVSSTDWSVVVFFNGNTLSGVAHLLPLLGVMLAALLIYVLGRNALINRLIFLPLNLLIQSVAEGKSTNENFYGKGRDDEIGDLAQTIRDSALDRQRQQQLLHVVNNTAAFLLTPKDDEDFEASLSEGLELIGIRLDVERINIWRNETIDGVFCYVNQFQWLRSDPSRRGRPAIAMRPYSENPEWEKKFKNNEYINGPISNLSQEGQAILGPQGVKSVLAIPLYWNGHFYGFVSFDDFHRERVFTEDEVNILRSAGLMIVIALNRREQEARLRQVHEHTQVLLDSVPLICHLIDKSGNIFDCNEAAVKIFNTKNKQEYIERFWELSPEYQDDGQLSREKIKALITKVFNEGRCVLEWMHQLFDGTPVPVEATLERVKVADEDVVAAYVRDLREYKKMISEIERQDYLLKDALEKAQTANSAKSSFLASMSHEMRTPLNAVIGLSELTMDSSGLSEEAFLNLEKIYSAGATLLSTVNDILDISKIEAGKLELLPVEYDMPSMINDAINQSIMRIVDKPIQFKLDISENLPARLFGDDLRIKQILNNLLSNAFKYTDEGTVNLSVSCKREDESVWMTISVSDTGKGIKSEDLEKMFSKYVQVDTVSNRKIEGTGLGLSITKKIAELMDGSISVESEYGKGSVFTVKIRQKFVNETVIGADAVKNLKELRYSNRKREQNSRLARIKLPYARVLVVDDVAANLDVAKGMMKPYGMQIDCVTSGQEAVDAIRGEKVKYNAVFMDHMMPGMDGIEAARIIREEIGTDYAKNIPVIALTANALIGNEKMFLSKGFQAFLTKPIEIARLDAVIQGFVRDKEQEKIFAAQIAEIQSAQDSHSGDGGQLPKIDGLDADKGLKRFSGDMESYINVLRSFAVNTPPLLEIVRGVTQNGNNLENYAVTVHGIKGSSRGICADALGDMAEALEKAAKAGDNNFVAGKNPAFLKACEKLIGDLEAMLGKMADENPKPKKEKPDGETLKRLLSACEKYQMDTVDSAMTELESYRYDSGGELVSWLRQNVDKMNFSEIKEKLSGV